MNIRLEPTHCELHQATRPGQPPTHYITFRGETPDKSSQVTVIYVIEEGQFDITLNSLGIRKVPGTNRVISAPLSMTGYIADKLSNENMLFLKAEQIVPLTPDQIVSYREAMRLVPILRYINQHDLKLDPIASLQQIVTMVKDYARSISVMTDNFKLDEMPTQISLENAERPINTMPVKISIHNDAPDAEHKLEEQSTSLDGVNENSHSATKTEINEDGDRVKASSVVSHNAEEIHPVGAEPQTTDAQTVAEEPIANSVPSSMASAQRSDDGDNKPVITSHPQRTIGTFQRPSLRPGIRVNSVTRPIPGQQNEGPTSATIDGKIEPQTGDGQSIQKSTPITTSGSNVMPVLGRKVRSGLSLGLARPIPVGEVVHKQSDLPPTEDGPEQDDTMSNGMSM